MHRARFHVVSSAVTIDPNARKGDVAGLDYRACLPAK
jgi:hypothetical protein